MGKECKNFNKCVCKSICLDFSDDVGINLCKSGKCKNKDYDFEKIVDYAFYPREGRKKDPHQYRIQIEPYNCYEKKVKELKTEILNAKNFNEIFELLTFGGKNKRYEHINGIGELTEYDISFRIGKCLGKCPDKVYLHAGTREGAEKLKGKKIKDKYLVRKAFEEFEYLADAPICQIENFLCVCKDNPNKDSFECYKKHHINGGIG